MLVLKTGDTLSNFFKDRPRFYRSVFARVFLLVVCAPVVLWVSGCETIKTETVEKDYGFIINFNVKSGYFEPLTTPLTGFNEFQAELQLIEGHTETKWRPLVSLGFRGENEDEGLLFVSLVGYGDSSYIQATIEEYSSDNKLKREVKFQPIYHIADIVPVRAVWTDDGTMSVEFGDEEIQQFQLDFKVEYCDLNATSAEASIKVFRKF